MKRLIMIPIVLSASLALASCNLLGGGSGSKKQSCSYRNNQSKLLHYWQGVGDRESTIKACKAWRNGLASKDGDSYCKGDKIKCS